MTEDTKGNFGEYEVGYLEDAVENTGKWYYMLATGALEAGMSWNDIREAIRKAGYYKGYNDYPRTSDLQAFAKAYAKESFVKTRKLKKVALTEDKFIYEVHHCPLVKSWKHFTDDKELISKLCDVYMDLERSVMETYGWNLEVEKAISKGNNNCTICIRKGNI